MVKQIVQVGDLRIERGGFVGKLLEPRFGGLQSDANPGLGNLKLAGGLAEALLHLRGILRHRMLRGWA